MEHILGKIYTYMSPKSQGTHLHWKDHCCWCSSEAQSFLEPLIFSRQKFKGPSLHSWGLPERPQPLPVYTQTPWLSGAWRGHTDNTGLPVPTRYFLSPHVALSPRVTSCPVLWPVCTLMSHLVCTAGSLGAPSQTPWEQAEEDGGWVRPGALGSGGRVGRAGWEVNQVSSLLATPNNDPNSFNTQRRTVPFALLRDHPCSGLSRGPPRRKRDEKPILPGAMEYSLHWGSGKPFSPGQAGHPSPAPEAPVTRSRASPPAALQAGLDTLQRLIFHLFPNPLMGPERGHWSCLQEEGEGSWAHGGLSSSVSPNGELNFL